MLEEPPFPKSLETKMSEIESALIVHMQKCDKRAALANRLLWTVLVLGITKLVGFELSNEHLTNLLNLLGGT